MLSGVGAAAPAPEPARKLKAEPPACGGVGAGFAIPIIPRPSKSPPPAPVPVGVIIDGGAASSRVGMAGTVDDMVGSPGAAMAGVGTTGTPPPPLAGVLSASAHISASNSLSALKEKCSPEPVGARAALSRAHPARKWGNGRSAAARSSVHFGSRLCRILIRIVEA